MPGLSVSDVVNVSVSIAPTAAPLRNFGALLLLGSTPNVIDTTQRLRNYSTLAGVGADFGTAAPEYLAASLFFGQSPQPAILYVGFWAQAATAAVLHGATLSAAQQAVSNFSGISNGGLAITVNGTVKTLAGINLTGVTTLPGVASAVTTALAGSATVNWNPTYARFDVYSSTTGIASTLTYASSTGVGTDLSVLMGLQTGQAQAPIAGIAAESAVSAVNTLIAMSNDWYGLQFAAVTPPANSDYLAVAATIEASNPSRIFGVTTQDSNVLVATATTDIAYQLQQLAYKRTASQFSSSSPYAAFSMFARAFTVDFTANNTTITLMYKGEPGVAAEALTEAQATALLAKNCNVFVNFNNSTAIIERGTMASGAYFDEIHGTDAMQNAAQTALYNLLYTSTTKIPQTDAGVNLLVTALNAVGDQFVNNGLLAPGLWTGPTIGALQTNSQMTKGYYVYAPPVSSQNLSDRSARKSPTLQMACKFAGAIHSTNVILNFNR
ncbi:MAG: DUF3383 domain-containing protein [Rhodospirillales bacterium]|nr:DUF3383 domain-containing protein [Rhodospirillales bacterium]